MGHRPASQPGNRPPIDPVLLTRPKVHAALASHDIGALFQLLSEHGWTQREIARATGMQQSTVCEIVKGRRVIGFQLLVRIADGLGIPRELMRLGPDEGSAYAGGGTATELAEEVIAEMRRRALLATAGIGIASRPLQGIGEPAKLPTPAPVPLPSRILPVHVAQVRDRTQRLREASRMYGSDPAVSSAAAEGANRLLRVPGTESITRALRTAVAELHLQAGWAAFDAGLYDRTVYHYNRALELAIEIGDAYLQAIALSYAGLATEEHGHPNDGLKMLQLAQFKAAEIPSDDQRKSVIGVSTRVAVEACARADSATALARLGHPHAADTQLAEARVLWLPGPADQNGDLDQVAARLQLARGRWDAAEPFAAASLRRWEGGTSQRARAGAGLLLATIHIRAGEPSGLRLAHSAIIDVAKLSSIRIRRRLDPLVTALAAQRSSDHRQLARMAHQVATSQA
ncbi:MAG: helix-turn-helix domain-containing protein [Pseudonocardiaceae bacterium]